MNDYAASRTRARQLRRKGMSLAKISIALAKEGFVTNDNKKFSSSTISTWCRDNKKRTKNGVTKKKTANNNNIVGKMDNGVDLTALLDSNLKDKTKLVIIRAILNI